MERHEDGWTDKQTDRQSSSFHNQVYSLRYKDTKSGNFEKHYDDCYKSRCCIDHCDVPKALVSNSIFDFCCSSLELACKMKEARPEVVDI